MNGARWTSGDFPSSRVQFTPPSLCHHSPRASGKCKHEPNITMPLMRINAHLPPLKTVVVQSYIRREFVLLVTAAAVSLVYCKPRRHSLSQLALGLHCLPGHDITTTTLYTDATTVIAHPGWYATRRLERRSHWCSVCQPRGTPQKQPLAAPEAILHTRHARPWNWPDTTPGPSIGDPTRDLHQAQEARQMVAISPGSS